MAQRYGLFDSTEIVQTIDGYPQGNRAETADFFAKYFSNFISNGVFAKPSTNFMVLSKDGLTVTVKAGCCFINGYMAWDSEDEDHTFTKDATTHNYYLVQRMYLPDGTITKTWLTDPDVSELPIRTATTYDLVIAKVTIAANVSEVTDSMITDYRFDTDMCGIVHGVVDQLDTSDLAHQLNTAAQEFITAAENSLATWEGTFDQWFEAVKGQLSGDAATALEANKTARMYAVCETAADTAAKVAALDGYYLAQGQTVYVRFVNAVPGGATLNVNGTGDIAINSRGQAITGADIPEGTVAALVYNGAAYDLLNAVVSAAGVKYITASGTSAIVANTADGLPAVLNDGDRFSVDFADEAAAGATLNINNLGAYPIIDNYTGDAIVLGDISAGYIGDIMFEDGRFVLLNAVRLATTPTGYKMFTADDTFVVPAGVTTIRVSACAAGVKGNAGEWIENQIYDVSPGQSIDLTIGTGNTIIGDLATLVAGSVAGSSPSTKLGYATGYSGGRSGSTDSPVGGGVGGHGGRYGYGGGGGAGSGSSDLNSIAGGGGGGGDAGNGSDGSNKGTGSTAASTEVGGAGGGGTGGDGGNSGGYTSAAEAGGNAKNGTLKYSGAAGTSYAGGKGSDYGAGGGGGANSKSGKYGGGGGAGGYGAGGGQRGSVVTSRSTASSATVYGTPSPGMVLIEWGGTVA